MSEVHPIFVAFCLWSSFGPPLRCNMLCTSGFMDDVMFSFNRLYGGVTLLRQSRCSVVNGITPLLCGIGCVLSYTTARGQDWTSQSCIV